MLFVDTVVTCLRQIQEIAGWENSVDERHH